MKKKQKNLLKKRYPNNIAINSHYNEKWDLDLILMSDEEFAYVAGLTREKIEQVKQKK